MARIDWSRWAPPDRDARQEAARFLWGLGGGAALAWVWFLSRYWSARSELFVVKNGRRVLSEGRMMPDLPEIIGISFLGLWAVLLWGGGHGGAPLRRHYRRGAARST